MNATKKLCCAALFALCSLASHTVIAQNDDPGKYLTAIYNPQQEMNKTYMSYISAVAHSRRPKKIEKLRMQTLDGIEKCRIKIIDVPFYKGDNSLRKSTLDYIQLCHKVFNEDYAHIVNMDEIAEQSFDEMQAYLLLQEKTDEKLHLAEERMSKALDTFAAKYNIRIIEGKKDELTAKMEKAGQLNKYYNKVYLLFFKCNWQDAKLVEAGNKKKLTDIEQSRNALASYAAEGLAALDTLKHFEGDASLAQTCRKVLTVYQKLAEDAAKTGEFFLKEEEFSKIKKSFDSKSARDRTQADVDAYNKGVNELNAAVNKFNQANATANNSRNQALEQWNVTTKNFMDAHMPYY